MVMMCGFHKRFPGIIIPRNLCSCTRAIEVLIMKVFNSKELICLRRGWKMMNLNLSGWTITLFALISDWFFTRIFPLPCPLERKRDSLSHEHGDAYVTFCHFGYEVFSEKTNKQANKTKQLSPFLTRNSFKRKSLFKNSFLSDKKVKKQNLSFQNRVLLQYWNEEILPQRRLNYCICKARRVCAGGSERI